MSLVIGIDPDCDKHGFAMFDHKGLVSLSQRSLVDIMIFLKGFDETDTLDCIKFSIEDVMANQFVYNRNKQQSRKVENKIAMNTGRCQQAQVELIRMLDDIGVLYDLYPPQKDNWADNEKLFSLATGWKGRSNKDTRSAAYFGFLSWGPQ